MEIRQVLDWLEPDELEQCAICGKQHGLRIEGTGSFICFGCGYINAGGVVTSVSAIQGRNKPRMVDDLSPTRRMRTSRQRH